MIETRASRGLLVFTLGALTGAAVAYLTAPRTGPESRRALRDWGRNLRSKTSRIPRGSAMPSSGAGGRATATPTRRLTVRSSHVTNAKGMQGDSL
jgi:gas vesicle protein